MSRDIENTPPKWVEEYFKNHPEHTVTTKPFCIWYFVDEYGNWNEIPEPKQLTNKTETNG